MGPVERGKKKSFSFWTFPEPQFLNNEKPELRTLFGRKWSKPRKQNFEPFEPTVLIEMASWKWELFFLKETSTIYLLIHAILFTIF